MAREAKPAIGPHLGHALGQLFGAANGDGWLPFGLSFEAVACQRQPRLVEGIGDRAVGRHQGHQHLLGPQRFGPPAATGIEIIWRDQAQQQQIRQPGEALGPEQGHVGVGLAGLAAGLTPLGRDGAFGHQIELRQQGDPARPHAHRGEFLAPLAGLVPALFTAGRDQFVGPKQRPLAFNVLKGRQFFPLVMQPGVVLHHGLMAIAPEALVAVGPAEVGSDLAPGALGQLGVFHRPGRVANHREAGAIHLFAGRFARQQALQGPPQPHDRVVGDHQAAAAVAMGPIEIKPVEGFEGGFHHADRTGVALGQAVVALVAPLPDAVIGHPIGPGHVVHQVLHEVTLVLALDHHQARTGELGQLQQEQRRGIELQMAPAVIGDDGIAAGGVELGVDRIEAIEALLKPLHLRGLAQHRVEQAPHQLQHPLFQLKHPPVVAPQALVCQGQTPDALDRIHAVAHPGIAVVAMHGVGRTGWQQSGDRVLTGQHHRFDLAVDLREHRPGVGRIAGAAGGGR